MNIKQDEEMPTKVTLATKVPKKQTGFVQGFLHIFSSTSYSIQGLVAGFRLSLAFRQECAVFLFLCFLLAFFDKPAHIWLISLFLWICVFAFELVNTALEECVDMISKEYSPTIKAIKDMASAAVFCFTMFNLVAQLYIFYDDLINLFL